MTYDATILQCQPGKRMAKRYRDPNKAPADYDAGALVRAIPVAFERFCDLIDALAALTHEQCLIRGGVRAEALPDVLEGLWVGRRVHPTKQGDPPAFEAVPRRWIVLDADDTYTPTDLDDLEGSIRAWHDTLHAELRGANAAFFPSAKTHRSDMLRGKLIVELAWPLSNEAAEVYAKAHGFDGSVCRAVQPNYFAPPIFEGCDDPIAAQRAPVLFGGVPLEIPEAVAPKRRVRTMAAEADAGEDAEEGDDTPTPRVLALATPGLVERWLAGDRVAGNAWLHLCGWLLGKHWVRGELRALLRILDADEGDDAKRDEHQRIMGNARAIEGPGGAREWLGDLFDAVDRTIAEHDPAAATGKRLRAKQRARAAVAIASGGEIDDSEGFAPTLALDTDDKGKPLPSYKNAAAIFAAQLGDAVRLEVFSGRIVAGEIDESIGSFDPGPWRDDHTTEAVILLNRYRTSLSSSAAHELIVRHARKRAFNALTDRLLEWAAAWDGVPRVDRAMSTYWGAPDVEASRAVARVFLLSMAARGLMPGCQVKTVLMLIGAQNISKSRSLRALAGADVFSDSALPIGSLDGMQNLRGKWVWEIAENAGVSQKDRNTVKAFFSSQSDTFRASYGRVSETVERQTVFAITTNDRETLVDPTGASRYHPIAVGDGIDVDAISRDREQLLGEAAARVLGGEQYWPTAAEEAAIEPAREATTELATRHDPWEDAIADWIAARAEGAPAITTQALTDLITGAVPMPAERLGRAQQMRVATCMRRLGYDSRRAAEGGYRRWVWELVADSGRCDGRAVAP